VPIFIVVVNMTIEIGIWDKPLVRCLWMG
jgi:hypothetical protein